ncbi:UDP-N-acetylmuramoylalanine--D-glutamate ligase [compost metagenome]
MKIAIAGYGLEGKSNYDYFKSHGEVTVVDERELVDDLPEGIPVLLGDGAFSRLDDFDLVVRTAGLSPHKIQTNGKVWSATNEFFEKCPAPIIGVTGSKGKGTTSSLIASILNEAGKTVHLVGNIGLPALDELARITEDDIVVYELSSFQLWDAERSPQVAVVLHIEPDHLDVHENFEEYVSAKGNIARYQGINDRVIYNALNESAATIADLSVGQRLPYQTLRTAHVSDGQFYYGEQLLCSVSELQLPGVHNQDNACAAITAVWPWVQDGIVIGEGLRAFGGLDHRLKFVAEKHGIAYYDDSIATTPGSAIAAMRAFEGPKLIILGGSPKGAQFDEVAAVAAQSNVTQVILIGEEAARIEQALAEAGVASIINKGSATTMQEVVQLAAEIAHAGDTVILSPACASFGMFRDYKDRGDQFIAAVNNLS